jgi:dienelactone hydrolase
MKNLAQLWAILPQISCVNTSKNGKWVFWCWSGLTETDEVYVVETKNPAMPQRLTHGEDHYSIRDVSADGSRLILAQSHNANEHDHLLLLDRNADNALRQLTPTQNTHYVYGGIFTADESAVIFSTNFDYEAGNTTDGGWIWQLDLASGKYACLAKSGTPFETGPKLSPDGTRLLWHRHEKAVGGTQLWTLNTDGTGLREALSISATSNARGHWLDNDKIAVVADVEGKDAVGIVSLATSETKWLAQEPELLPHETFIGHTEQFACIVHRQSNTEAVIFNPDGSWQPLANKSGRRSLLPHATLPDGSWIAEAYDAGAPHDLVRVTPDGTCTPLVSATDESSRTYQRPQDIRWTSVDGLHCQGWLYRPATKSKGLIVYVHGGPTWHSEDWVNPKIGFWVQSGYAVLDPNYRGSTGFGMAYRESIKEDGWGGREQADIRAGIEFLVGKGLAEKGRIAVVGNSYGGFSSWVAITRFADLVNAAIPMCGMYRLDIDYNETEMPHGRAYSEEMMGGRPDEVPEKYAGASPGNFIDQIRGHVLIVHGLADSNVGPENSHAAIRELTAAGIPHQSLLFDNEGHGVARTSNLKTYLETSLRFLETAFAKPD